MTDIQHDFLQDHVAHNYQDRQSGQQVGFEQQPVVTHDDGCYCVKSPQEKTKDSTTQTANIHRRL